MLRQQLLKDRYLLPGETSENEMYARVAEFIYGLEVSEEGKSLSSKLYGAMMNHVWLPNTPTLVNAGRPNAGGLSACYVLPIEDSLDGIYKTVWDAAKVHKFFGGTGFNFSKLRECGAPIKTTGGRACGPIKVMRLLNTSAGVVSQGGKREGANMGILNASHPDIHEFIRCKDDNVDLSHFNISVGLRHEDLKDDELIREIAEHAWRTGDPGIVFLDRLADTGVKHSSLPVIDCTNPCGEQPLRPYESCNLGSINLSMFPEILDGDTSRFQNLVEFSIRTLDHIIDINTFPIPEISDATLYTRKVGSGIMGWADWLVRSGISYKSREALDWIDKIGRIYKERAVQTSIELGKIYGCYPACFVDKVTSDIPSGRNETLMTIAPTGTISYLAECSWGIEPIYDWSYTRCSESGSEVIESKWYNTAKDHDLLSDVAKNIDYVWQINHIATWQKYVDNAVSKTINLPSTATVEDIIKCIKLAYSSGCKGITVYRDGSKSNQVVTSTKQKAGTTRQRSQESNKQTTTQSTDGHGIERYGTTKDYRTGCGRIHVTCNERDRDTGKPYEVYILSDGGCPASNEAIGKVLSKYLHDPRLEGGEYETVERIVKTLSKVDCPTAMRNSNSQGKSCAEIIAKRMREVWIRSSSDENKHKESSTGNKDDKMVEERVESNVCPQCGSEVDFGSGCRNGSCRVCGWSGCL